MGHEGLPPEKLESREEVVEGNITALVRFVSEHHRPDDHTDLEGLLAEQKLERFREAWSKPGGSVEWTPMLQEFKRIFAFYPNKEKRLSGTWNGELAVVIANETDSRDEKLTEALNTLIHDYTNRQWYTNPEL